MTKDKLENKKENTKLLSTLQNLRIAQKENEELKKKLSESKENIEELLESVNEVVDGNIFLKRKFKPNKINNLPAFNFIFSNFIDRLVRDIKNNNSNGEIINELFLNYFIKQRDKGNEVRFFNKNQFYNLLRLNNEIVFNNAITYMDLETSCDKRTALSVFNNYNCNRLDLFSKEIRSDRKVVEHAIVSSIENFSYIDCEDEYYIKFFLELFKKEKRIIQFADHRISSNRNIFYYSKEEDLENKINLYQYPEIIFLLDVDIINYYLKDILRNNGNILKYLPREIRDDNKNILSSLNSFPKNIKFLNLDFESNSDCESYKEIYKAYPETILFIDPKYKELFIEANQGNKNSEEDVIEDRSKSKFNIKNKINSLIKGNKDE